MVRRPPGSTRTDTLFPYPTLVRSTHATGAPAPQRARDEELRLYGFNAVQAVFARRPQAIRKLYLAEARIPQLQPLLKWCVANRVGYRVVDEADLRKLAASAHHEGVVADVLRESPQSLTAWLEALPPGPVCALWLDEIGRAEERRVGKECVSTCRSRWSPDQ